MVRPANGTAAASLCLVMLPGTRQSFEQLYIFWKILYLRQSFLRQIEHPEMQQGGRCWTWGWVLPCHRLLLPPFRWQNFPGSAFCVLYDWAHRHISGMPLQWQQHVSCVADNRFDIGPITSICICPVLKCMQQKAATIVLALYASFTLDSSSE